jgi:hypothetical protein
MSFTLRARARHATVTAATAAALVGKAVARFAKTKASQRHSTVATWGSLPVTSIVGPSIPCGRFEKS